MNPPKKGHGPFPPEYAPHPGELDGVRAHPEHFNDLHAHVSKNGFTHPLRVPKKF